MFIIVRGKSLAPGDNLNRINFHYSFQKQIVEMKNEIKYPVMNLLVYYCQECLTGFDLNELLMWHTCVS